RLRDLPLLRREAFDQLTRRLAWQFLEQRGAIVRRHFVQNSDHLFVRHCPQQILLLFDSEVFKDVGRQGCGQDTEDDDLLTFGKIENHLGDVGWRPFLEQVAQAVEIARADQAFDFGRYKFADRERAYASLLPDFYNSWWPT